VAAEIVVGGPLGKELVAAAAKVGGAVGEEDVEE